jgi:hypothetical protein
MTLDEAIELGERAKNVEKIKRFLEDGKKLIQGNDPEYYSDFSLSYKGRLRNYEESISISKEVFEYALDLIEEELKVTINEIEKYEANKA